MAKSASRPVPSFLKKGGGHKIAEGTEPPGKMSKKLPPVRPGGSMNFAGKPGSKKKGK